ncbi:GNAT family N-acetyltransferase [Arsenicicoccus dermatophilus]|uniref:GNAT family N-acetyltransferase n=1 Tax=Arsenicicoccus dermatophilus TaxID=1076331 RepID=UPI001F4C9501|nr:GNAT family protein [Arsenicicoccus dermatophilus]MCH8612431.1 GNAT family N-acetyltransferase [Arsenicicoccus dermatophilus]
MGFLEIDGAGQHPQTPRDVEALLGYLVEPRWQGRGIASELAAGLVEAAFDRLGLRRVRACCNRDNPPSARVLEKAGLRREEHTVADCWHAERGWVDGYGYGLLATEWRGEVTGLPELRDSSARVLPRRPLPAPVAGLGLRRTERLELGPAREQDVVEILAWRNLPQVGEWLLEPTTDEAALRRRLFDPGPGEHRFVARLDGRAVGLGFVIRGDAPGQPGGPVQGMEAEIGYCLDPAVSGVGLGREIACAALDLAFGELGVRRARAGLYADNVPSARLMAGMGMRREQHGVLDSWHPRHGWVDGASYAILAPEWRA